MKPNSFCWLTGSFLFILSNVIAGNQVGRVNELGYFLQSEKGTICLSAEYINRKNFLPHEASTGNEVCSYNPNLKDSFRIHGGSLAVPENEGRTSQPESKRVKDDYGAIIRLNPDEKNIYLVFTADSFFEGGSHILQVLEKRKIKGSFFFTGNFLRREDFRDTIKKAKKQGHYIGIHSDKYLLYCDWNNRDSTLISYSEFEADIKNNFKELERFGILPGKAKYFIPPYEWYNREIIEWCGQLGLEAVSFTPETGTNADYTTPDMEDYKSSVRIYANLLNFEKNNPAGLNGAILLVHPGTASERTDKFYRILEDVIRHFSSKGYQFKPINN